MINYYKTESGKRHLKIDNLSLDIIFLVINGELKVKSHITKPTTYNKFLEEVNDTTYWLESDETTFNEAFVQI